MYLATESETCVCAARLAAHLKGGACVTLSGDLGTGKSVFARALMRALGVLDEVMPSPSFSLIQEYQGRHLGVVHMDWYRLEGVDEVALLGIEEYFSKDWISIIEWSERAESLLPKHAIRLHLSYVHEHADARELTGLPGNN